MDLDRKTTNFIGECLEDAVARSFKSCGYSVRNHKVSQGGVDVHASSEKEVIVCECWNWKRESYPEPERIESIIKNFNSHPNAKKFLITAHKVDFGKFKSLLSKKGIKPISIGKQLLSKSLENLKLVFSRLLNERVLYFNYNITIKKKENKEKESKIEAKVPVERIFETSKAVVFCFRTAFNAILNQLKNDSRFVIANFMKFR